MGDKDCGAFVEFCEEAVVGGIAEVDAVVVGFHADSNGTELVEGALESPRGHFGMVQDGRGEDGETVRVYGHQVGQRLEEDGEAFLACTAERYRSCMVGLRTAVAIPTRFISARVESRSQRAHHGSSCRRTKPSPSAQSTHAGAVK